LGGGGAAAMGLGAAAGQSGASRTCGRQLLQSMASLTQVACSRHGWQMAGDAASARGVRAAGTPHAPGEGLEAAAAAAHSAKWQTEVRCMPRHPGIHQINGPQRHSGIHRSMGHTPPPHARAHAVGGRSCNAWCPCRLTGRRQVPLKQLLLAQSVLTLHSTLSAHLRRQSLPPPADREGVLTWADHQRTSSQPTVNHEPTCCPRGAGDDTPPMGLGGSCCTPAARAGLTDWHG